MISDPQKPGGEVILFQTEDQQTRLQVRLDGQTAWLTQAQLAELFQITVPTVNEHLKGIYAEGELISEATIRNFRMVRLDGGRQVSREIEHYNLEAILAVGYRVRSLRGTQFRIWATQRLREYLVKGFTMDDWIAKLDEFLKISGRRLLDHTGSISHEQAVRKAELEFAKFRALEDARPTPVEKDFEATVKN